MCLASSRSQNGHVITSPHEKDAVAAGLDLHLHTLLQCQSYKMTLMFKC